MNQLSFMRRRVRIQFIECLERPASVHPSIADEVVQTIRQNLGHLLNSLADTLGIGDIEIDKDKPPILVTGL
jgi:hypothetical protein